MQGPTSRGIGKVLEFAGPGLGTMPMDEQATLTNMAVEAGGFTGILEPSEVIVEYLHEMRGVDKDEIRKRIVTSDPDAQYLELHASQVREQIAVLMPHLLLPRGDTQKNSKRRR